MNNPSRNHHFVPVSLLKFFSIDGFGSQVHVFDKQTGRTFTPAIEKAGSENNFNRIKLPDGPELNFEPLFDDIDSTLHRLLKTIQTHRNVAALTDEERADWADVIAAQLLRTPLARSTQVQAAADLSTSLVDSGLVDPAAFIMLTDNDSRWLTVRSLLERSPFRAALFEKDFALFEPSGTKTFWISDHPVTLESTVPYGERGLASPGIAVYMPLSPTLVLGLICKSVAATLNARPIEQLQLEREHAAHYIAVREGLRSGAPIPWTDEQVDAFNLRQVGGSARFIYTHRDVSAAVTSILQQYPDLRAMRTNVRVGKMGEGFPSAPRMPEGKWLVLFGQRNHHMVRVREWKEDGHPIEVTIDDIETMNRALTDGPFSEIRLYEDRLPRRGMRDARIEIVSPSRPARVTIRHSDVGLDALMETIARTTK